MTIVGKQVTCIKREETEPVEQDIECANDAQVAMRAHMLAFARSMHRAEKVMESATRFLDDMVLVTM